jgi:indolepyruvate decarboxylase
MFAEITEAQTRVTPENAVAEIDRLILTAWRRKLLVYLELPCDIPYLEIEVPDGPLKLEMIPSEQKTLKACTKMILERLHAAKSPAFLLDIDAIRFGVSKQIVALADRFQMQVATLNCAKGLSLRIPHNLLEPTRVLQAPPRHTRRSKEATVC